MILIGRRSGADPTWGVSPRCRYEFSEEKRKEVLDLIAQAKEEQRKADEEKRTRIIEAQRARYDRISALCEAATDVVIGTNAGFAEAPGDDSWRSTSSGSNAS